MSSPLLHIAVVGVGNIGSTFAYQFARAGHDVTVVARPSSARLLQLQRDRAIVPAKGERAKVRVADTLDEQTAYDIVLVTLLAHQVDAVLPSLQRSAAKTVQFMFVTWDPEYLRDAVGPQRATFGMPFVQATLDKEGKLHATIGSQKTIMSKQDCADILIAAGVPAAVEPDMLLWLRCHSPLCAAFESVCVAGMQHGGGASWAESMNAARGMHACFALLQHMGYQLYPNGKARLNSCPAFLVAAMLCSVSRITSFRELLAGGKQECLALLDKMLQAAATAHLPAAQVASIQAMKPSPNK